MICDDQKHKFHLYDYATLWINFGLRCRYCNHFFKFSFIELGTIGLLFLAILISYVLIVFYFIIPPLENYFAHKAGIYILLIFLLLGLTGLILADIVYFKAIHAMIRNKSHRLVKNKKKNETASIE